MTEICSKIAGVLGRTGVAALLAMAACAAFHWFVVIPLEATERRLDQALEQAAERKGAAGFKNVAMEERTDQMAAFRTFLARPETKDIWLAKLFGIATAVGLEFRIGEYQLAQAQYGIERYQVTLPVTGTYSQIRAFSERALAEIPILSLDRANFRRKDVGDAKVEAEIALTFHMAGR